MGAFTPPTRQCSKYWKCVNSFILITTFLVDAISPSPSQMTKPRHRMFSNLIRAAVLRSSRAGCRHRQSESRPCALTCSPSLCHWSDAQGVPRTHTENSYIFRQAVAFQENQFNFLKGNNNRPSFMKAYQEEFPGGSTG